MPGGGFVAIDVEPVFSATHERSYHGTLILERRANWRRDGHLPPVIDEASGDTIAAVMDQLLPTADNNPALAVAVLRHAPVAR